MRAECISLRTPSPFAVVQIFVFVRAYTRTFIFGSILDPVGDPASMVFLPPPRLSRSVSLSFSRLLSSVFCRLAWIRGMTGWGVGRVFGGDMQKYGLVLCVVITQRAGNQNSRFSTKQNQQRKKKKLAYGVGWPVGTIRLWCPHSTPIA